MVDREPAAAASRGARASQGCRAALPDLAESDYLGRRGVREPRAVGSRAVAALLAEAHWAAQPASQVAPEEPWAAQAELRVVPSAAARRADRASSAARVKSGVRLAGPARGDRSFRLVGPLAVGLSRRRRPLLGLWRLWQRRLPALGRWNPALLVRPCRRHCPRQVELRGPGLPCGCTIPGLGRQSGFGLLPALLHLVRLPDRLAHPYLLVL